MAQEALKKQPPASRHDLDDTALGTWLEREGMIPGLKLPIKSSKIGYGQSNPTYFVDDARYVYLDSATAYGKALPGTLYDPCDAGTDIRAVARASSSARSPQELSSVPLRTRWIASSGCSRLWARSRTFPCRECTLFVWRPRSSGRRST